MCRRARLTHPQTPPNWGRFFVQAGVGTASPQASYFCEQGRLEWHIGANVTHRQLNLTPVLQAARSCLPPYVAATKVRTQD
jgi:hypothetical protein